MVIIQSVFQIESLKYVSLCPCDTKRVHEAGKLLTSKEYACVPILLE